MKAGPSEKKGVRTRQPSGGRHQPKVYEETRDMQEGEEDEEDAVQKPVCPHQCTVLARSEIAY